MERRAKRDSSDVQRLDWCAREHIVFSSLISLLSIGSSIISDAVLKCVRTAPFLAVLACAPKPSVAQQSFPFEFEDARLFVPVQLSDSSTRWLILDTGASPTILDANVAAALHLVVTPAGSTTGAGTNSLRVGRAHGVALRVGGVTLGPTNVTVSEIDSVLAPSQGRHAPGIIGSPRAESYLRPVYDALG